MDEDVMNNLKDIESLLRSGSIIINDIKSRNKTLNGSKIKAYIKAMRNEKILASDIASVKASASQQRAIFHGIRRSLQRIHNITALDQHDDELFSRYALVLMMKIDRLLWIFQKQAMLKDSEEKLMMILFNDERQQYKEIDDLIKNIAYQYKGLLDREAKGYKSAGMPWIGAIAVVPLVFLGLYFIEVKEAWPLLFAPIYPFYKMSGAKRMNSSIIKESARIKDQLTALVDESKSILSELS